MEKLVSGIHHVTALAGEPQQNLDFYSGVLGLRMVKKTVNFDAPEIYHFYYGNQVGAPGTILTFFPYTGIKSGRPGKGMVSVTSFSVSSSSFSYWKDRLSHYKVDFSPVQERFEQETVIRFRDPDGLILELVFNDRDERVDYPTGNIPEAYAIKGFYSVELWLEGYEKTADLLAKCLDYHLIHEQENRFRFASTDAPGNYVDILCTPDSLRGLSGGGTVHHLAFNTPDTTTQETIRKKLLESGVNPTPTLDRQYFKSIYFREPGGVLFEVATAIPGFAVDENLEELGQSLMLPPQYQSQRQRIEEGLKPVELNPKKFK